MAKAATSTNKPEGKSPQDRQGGEYGRSAGRRKRGNVPDFTAHKARIARIWSTRDAWDYLYKDAYEFVIPQRRPSERVGKGGQQIERLFDATAIKSAFRAAGKLHQDLFPPGFWKLAVGAVTQAAVKMGKVPKKQVAEMTRQLEGITDLATAFFQTGEFDAASSEMCIDVLVGTATLFPMQGDVDNPVRWVCIPFDEIAIEIDAYGKVVVISWKSKLTRRSIMMAFPNGDFPKEFVEAHKSAPDEEIEIYQDFIFDPTTKRWTFCPWLAQSEQPITTDEYKTQPMAVPRYHRVPGEAYGRGPILLALPTIKTLNKAVELTLKSAAIQMLGIWGYRPGGSFNPDTVRLGPGQFWPMQATGGVLGPDVTRLDTSSGKVDVGQLVSNELRLQVQSMLNDDSLPDKGATPVSATEIMARLQRIAQNHLGAWGRLVQEIVPIIVQRVLEILYSLKLIDVDIKLDELLVKVDVLSPIAAAVKAGSHQRIIEFIQLVGAVKGDPRAAELIVKVDEALRLIGGDQLPASLMMTEDEQRALEKKLAAAAAQLAAAQAGTTVKAKAA